MADRTMKPIDATDKATCSAGCSYLTFAAYALPPALLALMVVLYAASPSFYLTYVLESLHRETQAVEIFTFICGTTASVLLFWSARQLWRLEWNAGQVPGLPGGAMIVGTIALATFFFTGEEISWGQSYLRFQTPESYRETNAETNLHNADTLISVQSLGSAFLVSMFLGLPLAWRFRKQLKLPGDWQSAVAEGPVVFAFICAFAWTRTKGVYLAMTTAEDRASNELYVQFIEQMKEHKEMLIALALLMYGVYRVRRVLALRAAARGVAVEAEMQVGVK